MGAYCWYLMAASLILSVIKFVEAELLETPKLSIRCNDCCEYALLNKNCTKINNPNNLFIFNLNFESCRVLQFCLTVTCMKCWGLRASSLSAVAKANAGQNTSHNNLNPNIHDVGGSF
jgi:hypothetical protein